MSPLTAQLTLCLYLVRVAFAIASTLTPALLLISLMGAGRAAVAIIDQIRAVSKERLDRIIGSVSNQEIAAVENGLRRVLGTRVS